MSLVPNQRILPGGGRQPSGPVRRSSASGSLGGVLNAIFGPVSQKRGILRGKNREGRGVLKGKQLERFLELPSSIRTRNTAAGNAAARISLEPGIPIERMSEIPRVGTVSGFPASREITHGIPTPVPGPIVHLPAGPAPSLPPATRTIPKEAPVSIWADLGKSITKGITSGVTQRIQSKIAPGIVAAPAIAAAAGRVLPALGRVLGSRTVAAASTGAVVGAALFGGAGGDGACPVGYHLNKQDGVGGPARSYCVRNRRMNVGNARAARRSVRRLKGARKLLRDIEKMMPTRTTRRRAPAGHSAHLHHTGG